MDSRNFSCLAMRLLLLISFTISVLGQGTHLNVTSIMQAGGPQIIYGSNVVVKFTPVDDVVSYFIHVNSKPFTRHWKTDLCSVSQPLLLS